MTIRPVAHRPCAVCGRYSAPPAIIAGILNGSLSQPISGTKEASAPTVVRLPRGNLGIMRCVDDAIVQDAAAIMKSNTVAQV